jgi:transposase
LTLWITLSYLPPYSPNLNLIERLRKFMKVKLVKNKYYKTLDEFRAVFISFFSNISQYYYELKRIFDNKFQILKAV